MLACSSGVHGRSQTTSLSAAIHPSHTAWENPSLSLAVLQRHGLYLSDLAPHDLSADRVLSMEQHGCTVGELCAEIESLQEQLDELTQKLHRWVVGWHRKKPCRPMYMYLQS